MKTKAFLLILSALSMVACQKSDRKAVRCTTCKTIVVTVKKSVSGQTTKVDSVCGSQSEIDSHLKNDSVLVDGGYQKTVVTCE